MIRALAALAAAVALVRWLVPRARGVSWRFEVSGWVAPVDDGDDGDDPAADPDPMEPYRRGLDGDA